MAKSDEKPVRKRKAAPKVRKPSGRNQKMVRWLLLFAASLIVVDGLVGERGLLAMLRAQHEYDELAATINRQRVDNARLRDEARRLTDDPITIEEVARRDLGLIRPGEKLFIVKDITPKKP